MCTCLVLQVWVYVDNSRIYVLDHHNIGIGGVLDVVVSQHLTMVLDIVLTLFSSEWGHPSKWVWELVEALQLLKRTIVPVGSVTFVGAPNVAQIGDYHIA